MRTDAIFAPGEHYHLLGRGNHKQKIFFDERDYIRFLLTILFFQFDGGIPQMRHLVEDFIQHRVLDKIRIPIAESRLVRLLAFTLMPNHYHVALEELVEGGISRYMQKVLNSFTKYHNVRYEKTGHLLQGPFKAVHQETNEQLLYLSAYMHRNPRELKEWRGREIEYPWSSYQDFFSENRWGTLLDPAIILAQFKDGDAYRMFVESSGAKEQVFIQHSVLDK